MEDHQQLQALNRKVEFLHLENQQLRQQIEDLNLLVQLNKKQLRTLLTYEDEELPKKPNQSMSIDYKTIRSGANDNKAKALYMVIEEKDREIAHLTKVVDKIQKERDFAQGKALINEEITIQAERSEQQLIAHLQNNINELQTVINNQSDRIVALEKQNASDDRGVIIKYREVIHPNTQTILMHEEMEVFHKLTIKLQNQTNYLKSVQVKLITMLHALLSCVGEGEDLSNIPQKYIETANIIQNDFIMLLDNLQKSTYIHFDSKSSKQSVKSPINKQSSDLHSPILSPLPNKVVIPKKKQNLNQTFDASLQYDDCVPKLNLDKAFQIQQINAKRSTQQSKMTEEMMQYKIKKYEQEIDETKQAVQREMLLAKHFEIENDQMRRQIIQLQSTNDTLVQSNMKYRDNWHRIQKGYLFYKSFFVENKDQYSTLKHLVESHKESHEQDESDLQGGFISERIKKDTRRKRTQASDLNKTFQAGISSQALVDISSLIDVERAMGRKQHLNTLYSGSQYGNQVQSEMEANDFELGQICMEREDSPGSRIDWRENVKRQWGQMANQVFTQKPRELAQKVKSINIKHNRAQSMMQ